MSDLIGRSKEGAAVGYDTFVAVVRHRCGCGCDLVELV